MPPDGNRLRPNAKTRMNRIPNTQGGITVVVIEAIVKPRSMRLSAFRAIRSPSHIPRMAAITDALVNRRIVRGRRSRMMSPTASPPCTSRIVVARPSWNLIKSHVKRNDF